LFVVRLGCWKSKHINVAIKKLNSKEFTSNIESEFMTEISALLSVRFKHVINVLGKKINKIIIINMFCYHEQIQH
jgi:hypothetical protein